VGLSNTMTAGGETHIFRDATANVPMEVREGFLQTLQSSINVLNKKNKLKKAAYSTSEDALTWTYFNHLRLKNRLRELGCLPSRMEPTLILWGSVVDATGTRSAVPTALAEISRELLEDADRRTEPDVILDYGKDGIAVIEVKYRSPNEFKDASYPGWARYLQRDGGGAFLDLPGVLSSKCYELVRNWRFAWELGNRLDIPVVVANLGRSSLFETPGADLLAKFEACLRQDARHRFRRLNWRDLLDRAPPDSDLSEYFQKKYTL
jgi:hypothetical protein